jgi:hypothetical protein
MSKGTISMSFTFTDAATARVALDVLVEKGLVAVDDRPTAPLADQPDSPAPTVPASRPTEAPQTTEVPTQAPAVTLTMDDLKNTVRAAQKQFGTVATLQALHPYRRASDVPEQEIESIIEKLEALG